MRLIDADALCEYANNLIDKTVDANDIMRFPRVDAVPVVRCRDCRYYNTAGCCKGFGWCYRNGAGHGTSEDWYCADGERQEDEGCAG